MIEDLGRTLGALLGLGSGDLSTGQMVARAILVYAAMLVIVRLGERRFLGKSTPFDFILGIMLGSVGSRAITDDILTAAGTRCCSQCSWRCTGFLPISRSGPNASARSSRENPGS